MNRRVLLGVVAAMLLVVGLVGLMLSRSPRSQPEGAAATAAPAPARAVRPAGAAPPARERPAAPRADVRPPPADLAAPIVENAESPPSAAAPPEVGTLRIETDVAGAQVFLDRQFIGTAPVTAENVRPGGHQLNVSAEGFTGIARTIDVEPGPRDIVIRFREVRLDAKAAVIHKHRIGSCKGQLVATPQGLRYETSDKDDGFNIALSDLEGFQVDYQDKNLRVKVRRGKQYDFTDPDGNADRLFVFHRDVDTARQRLAKGDQAVN